MQLTAYISNQADELHTISYTWRDVTPEALASIATKLSDLLDKWIGEMDLTTHATLIGLDLVEYTTVRTGSLQHISRTDWVQILPDLRPLMLGEILDRLYFQVLQAIESAESRDEK